MYFVKPVGGTAKGIHDTIIESWVPVKQLVSTAFLAAISALLQSAGGFLPGIGYVISPFSTAPIALAFLISLRFGFLSYLISCLVLLIIQPSELVVFPFTTGLLGVGLGIGFRFLTQRITLILAGALPLLLGMTFLLYVLNFPLLGPNISTSFNIVSYFILIVFSLGYALLWVEGMCLLLKWLRPAFSAIN